MISALIAEILVEFGHDVCGVTRSKQETIEAAAQCAPDLMIVDAQLRAGTGIAAMDAILRQAAMPHIFMTGGTLQTFPPETMVLRKPFAAADLKALVETVSAQIAALAEGSVDVQP